MPLTWDNCQQGGANVKARIDRAFANEQFRQMFGFTGVRHISSAESDHCFVRLEFQKQMCDTTSRSKPFRYENIWQTHVDYERIVTECWHNQQHSPGLQGVMESLGALQQRLDPWGKKEFGCLRRTVRKLQQKLDKLRRLSIGRGPNEEEKSTVIKLREALRQDEIWVRQRSRVLWLRDGDRNTEYFQAQAK